MRLCRLRTAFATAGTKDHKHTPATRIGEICHLILQEVATARVASESAEIWAGNEWTRRIDDLRTRIQGAVDESAWGPPERWPNFEIKRARLELVARKLAALLESLPDDTEFLTEVDVQALGGTLRGRIDLLVKSPASNWVIDYKTGEIYERGSAEIKGGYAMQLKLYALLAFESSGHWPDRAFLFPLHGEFAEIQVDPEECLRLGNEAVGLLREYNSSTPGPQPPALTVEACGICPYSSRCEPFWEILDTGWAPDLFAVRGSIRRVLRSRVGGVSLELGNEGGSLKEAEVLLRNIDPLHFPAVERAAVGDFAAVTGLRQETGRPSYRVTARTSLTLLEQPNAS